MGAFRDYFNGLYNNYLKTPIVGVQNKMNELKTGVEQKLETIKAALTGISDKVLETGSNITKGIVASISENAKALVGAFATLAAPLTSIVDIIAGFLPGYNMVNTIRALKSAHSKEELQSIWDVLEVGVKENILVVKVYQAVAKELDIQGFESPANLAAGFIGEQIAAAIWKIEAVALPNIMDWVDSFAAGYNMNKDDIASMKKLANAGEFGLNAVVNFMLGVTLYPAVMSAGEPAWVLARQQAYKALPVTLLDARTLVSLKYKEYIPEGLYKDQFGKLGFPPELTELLEKDFLYYPGANDFIRFAVRETFSPQVVEAYGYDEAFPSDIVPYAAKAGLSKEWLQHYWRAHWEIPSPRQGYEMLHRGIIDKAQLVTLLKIADFAPGWVQPLIDISYSPITRVDLRRLFRDGIIDEDRMYQGYLDIGYSPENAELITEWTIKDTFIEDKNLTKTEVLRSFRIGETSKEQTLKFLGELGYSDENAKFVLSYEEYKQAAEERNEEIQTVIAELVEGRYTIAEVKSKLAAMDVSIKQANQLIQKAEQLIRKRFVLPSKEDCLRWLKNGIIDVTECTVKLTALRYQEEDIKKYIEEVKG